MEVEILNGRDLPFSSPAHSIKFYAVEEGEAILLPGHEPIIALGEAHSLEIDGINQPTTRSFLVYSRTVDEVTRVSILVSGTAE